MSLHAVRVYRGFVVLWHWRNFNVMFICIQFSMWPSICRSGVFVCVHACASVANRWHSDDEFDIMLEFRIAGRRGCCHSSCRLITRKMIHFLLQNRIVEGMNVVVVIELNVFQHLRTIYKEFSSTFFHFLLLVACAPCDSLAANQKIRKFSVRITWMTFRTMAGHSRSGQTVRICCRIVYA